MQFLKQRKMIALISLLIAVILIIFTVVIIENASKPTTGPISSSPPSATPTETFPSPTVTPTLTPTAMPTSTARSTPINGLYPGEIIQYQNQSLTPINQYIQDLIEHPDVAIEGTQNINQTTYHLAITGMVNNPTNYTYDEVINNFNSTLQVATLYCVEGWSVTMLWQGVPISELLDQAGADPNATTLIFFASDGYSTSLPISYVNQNNIMLAYKMNNVTFTAQTGWPFFLVAENQYGYKWIRWITEINVSNDSSYLGYWESRGYPNNATVQNPTSSIQPTNNLTVIIPSASILIAFAVVAAASLIKSRKNRKQLEKNSKQFLEF